MPLSASPTGKDGLLQRAHCPYRAAINIKKSNGLNFHVVLNKS
jgi:hypothetical protein